jgi:DHA1 family tetracycline resistance protein-like MFS transporter
VSDRRTPPGYWVLWTTVAIDLVGFGIVLPILPLFAKDVGAGPVAATALVASFSLAQFLVAPLWGRLSDRIGRRPVIVASLLGTTVGYLITAGANSLWVLLLGRLIDGLSGSTYGVAQAAVADSAPPAERPRLLGLLGAAFGVGFVAGPVIGALAAFGGRRVPFLVAAAIALANAIAAWVRLRETAGPARSTPTDDRPGIAGSGNEAGHGRRVLPHLASFQGPSGDVLARLAALGLAGTLAFSGFEATFALLVDDRFGSGKSLVYVLFTLIGIALVLVQVRVVGPLSQAKDGRWILRRALACNALGFVALAWDGGWIGLAVALALLVLGQGLLSPTLAAVTSVSVAASRRGEALGVQQSATALGRIGGPLVAGALFGHVSTAAPYLLAAVCVAVAMTLVPRPAPVHDDVG